MAAARHHLAGAGVTHPASAPPGRFAARPNPQPSRVPPQPAQRPPGAPTSAAPSPRTPPPFPRPTGSAVFKSSLAQRAECREKRYRIFPVSGFFGVGGKPLERVGILYATGRDTEAALFGALRYVKEVAEKTVEKGASERFLSDADLLNGAKLRELLFRVCRAVDPARHERLKNTANGANSYPAFPSPTWIRDNLGPDEIAALMNLVVEVRQEFAPRRGSVAGEDGDPEPWGFDDEAVDRMAAEIAAVALAGGQAEAGGELAHLPRAALTRYAVRLAERLVAAQRTRDALLSGATVAPTGG